MFRQFEYTDYRNSRIFWPPADTQAKVFFKVLVQGQTLTVLKLWNGENINIFQCSD